MDGLIHISELSWSHVNHPSEVLEIGQEVKVKVLDIDRERQRISLGLKQTQSDPWQQVLESYSENDVVEGRVTKVVTFGAASLCGFYNWRVVRPMLATHPDGVRQLRGVATMELVLGLVALVLTSILTSMPMPEH